MPPDRRQCHRWSGLNKQIKHGWPSFLIQLPIYTVHRGYRYIHYLYRYYTEDRETWSRKPRGCNQQSPDHGKLQDKQPGLSNTSNEVVRRKREKKEERKERGWRKNYRLKHTHTKDTSANHKMWALCGSQFRWTVKRQQNLWHLRNNWKSGHWLDAGSYRTALSFILNKTTGLLFFKTVCISIPKWQPTPVLLPRESHGQRSLVGYSPWGHKESDTTERLTHTHYGENDMS